MTNFPFNFKLTWLFPSVKRYIWAFSRIDIVRVERKEIQCLQHYTSVHHNVTKLDRSHYNQQSCQSSKINRALLQSFADCNGSDLVLLCRSHRRVRESETERNKSGLKWRDILTDNSTCWHTDRILFSLFGRFDRSGRVQRCLLNPLLRRCAVTPRGHALTV